MLEEQTSLCRACKRNFTEEEWKKHGYSRTHKENLERILQRESNIIKPFLHPGEPPKEFFCFFCEVSPAKLYQEEDPFSTICKHLAGNSHYRKLTRFWKDYFVKHPMSGFFLSKTQLQKNLTPIAPKKEVPQGHAPLPIARPPEVPKPKTLVSKLGIIQNPTGMHEGQRVWGGGIIKVAQNEWIPWPIDLDTDTNLEGESFMGAAPVRGVHQDAKKAIATSTKLASVARTSSGGPNIHTPGAIPPWIKPYEVQLFPELVQALTEARTKIIESRKNENRVGAAWVAQRKAMGDIKTPDNWLPNFGRAFTPGPRSATVQEFRREQSNAANIGTTKRRREVVEETPSNIL